MQNACLKSRTDRTASIILKYFILIVAIIFLIGYFSVLADGYNDYNGEQIPIIIGDGYGYYFYLPYYLIDYKDIPFERLTSHSDFESFWDKYQVGEALMMLPFFLIGHLISIISSYPADGYSFFYQHAAALSGLFYSLAGIYLLKKTLERYFSQKVTLITLIAIIFGTNLYYYSTFASLFSHSFSFFLCSLLIYLVPRWFKNPGSKKITLILGIAAGLIILVRLPNILMLLLLFLYKIHSIEDLRKRFIFFIRNYKSLLLIISLIIILFIPQIITWKLTYNQWFVYSYGEAKFHFQQLYIGSVLFSFRRGLLFWSPILCFGIAGLWSMRKKLHDFYIYSLLLLLAITFINSSFDRWWFGASFGHRGFTEFLPVFAIAIAAFYSSLENKGAKIAVYILSGLFIFYSIIQMLFLLKGFIQMDLITPLSYRDFFIKLYSFVRNLIQTGNW